MSGWSVPPARRRPGRERDAHRRGRAGCCSGRRRRPVPLEFTEAADLGLVDAVEIGEPSRVGTLQRLENDEGPALEIVRQTLQKRGRVQTSQRCVAFAEIVGRDEHLGRYGIAPPLDLGLTLVARIFVADPTGSAPHMRELVGEREQLSVQGLMGVHEHEGGCRRPGRIPGTRPHQAAGACCCRPWT